MEKIWIKLCSQQSEWISYWSQLHLLDAYKKGKKVLVSFFFLKFLTTYLLKEVSWVATDRKWQVASRWELWTSTVSNSCPFWVSMRLSFVLGITLKAWSGADAGTQMCVCGIGLFMVPDFRLTVAVHASFLLGGREDTQCLLWCKTFIHTTNPSKIFDPFEQEGVCVLHRDVLFNLEFNGQNLVLLYHQTTGRLQLCFMSLGR